MTAGRPLDVIIVGATGAVGEKLISLLAAAGIAVSSLTLVASGRSAGHRVKFRGQPHLVTDFVQLNRFNFDLAFFSAGGSVSAQWAPRFAAEGALVIDNSNAFRMRDDVPLVVPQVNPHALGQRAAAGIVANPNCSTIQLVRALAPVERAFGIEQVVLATYQAASGGGRKGIDELITDSKDVIGNKESSPPHRFPVPLGFNAVPQVGAFLDGGFTLEERKLVRETRKILQRFDLRLTATCVRVAVVNGHSEAVHVECREPVDLGNIKALLAGEAGIQLYDETGACPFPTPRLLQQLHKVHIGRLRVDPENPHGLWMWVVADNLQVGAALNAVQIAELAVTNGILKGDNDREGSEVRRVVVS